MRGRPLAVVDDVWTRQAHTSSFIPQLLSCPDLNTHQATARLHTGRISSVPCMHWRSLNTIPFQHRSFWLRDSQKGSPDKTHTLLVWDSLQFRQDFRFWLQRSRVLQQTVLHTEVQPSIVHARPLNLHGSEMWLIIRMNRWTGTVLDHQKYGALL